MFIFAKIILKLLSDYKSIIKKHHTHAEWIAKINKLGLKRKVLKNDNDAALYHKAHKVIEDISAYLNQNPQGISSWHSGLDEFCQHLKNIMSEYKLENNQVVHLSQHVSRTLVEALQLINHTDVHKPTVANKLEQCGQVVAKYGTRQQQELFSKALKNSQLHDVNLFLPLSHNFEKHLREFAAFFTDQPGHGEMVDA